jgi:hypothetical protein
MYLLNKEKTLDLNILWIEVSIFLLIRNKRNYRINVTGKLQNNLKAVVKKRKLIVKNNRIIPIYTIEDLTTGKVSPKMRQI